MTKACWRLFYADGSTYGPEDGPPERAPGYDVQAIAQPDRTPGTGNVGYVVTSGYDFYFWHLEALEWMGVAGEASLLDQILSRQPITGISQGRLIPRTRYEAILEAARAWAEGQDLPRKSGNRPGERRR